MFLSIFQKKWTWTSPMSTSPVSPSISPAGSCFARPLRRTRPWRGTVVPAARLSAWGHLQVGRSSGALSVVNLVKNSKLNPPGRLTAGTWEYTTGPLDKEKSSEPNHHGFRFYVNLPGCNLHKTYHFQPRKRFSLCLAPRGSWLLHSDVRMNLVAWGLCWGGCSPSPNW